MEERTSCAFGHGCARTPFWPRVGSQRRAGVSLLGMCSSLAGRNRVKGGGFTTTLFSSTFWRPPWRSSAAERAFGPLAMPASDPLPAYYSSKIEELEVVVRDRTQNLRRLEAQRNELNSKVRLLREEISLLQEPGSYVGEVVNIMGRKKVLVKVHPEGKYVVDIDKSIDITGLHGHLKCRRLISSSSTSWAGFLYSNAFLVILITFGWSRAGSCGGARRTVGGQGARSGGWGLLWNSCCGIGIDASGGDSNLKAWHELFGGGSNIGASPDTAHEEEEGCGSIFDFATAGRPRSLAIAFRCRPGGIASTSCIS